MTDEQKFELSRRSFIGVLLGVAAAAALPLPLGADSVVPAGRVWTGSLQTGFSFSEEFSNILRSDPDFQRLIAFRQFCDAEEDDPKYRWLIRDADGPKKTFNVYEDVGPDFVDDDEEVWP